MKIVICALSAVSPLLQVCHQNLSMKTGTKGVHEGTTTTPVTLKNFYALLGEFHFKWQKMLLLYHFPNDFTEIMSLSFIFLLCFIYFFAV